MKFLSKDVRLKIANFIWNSLIIIIICIIGYTYFFKKKFTSCSNKKINSISKKPCDEEIENKKLKELYKRAEELKEKLEK